MKKINTACVIDDDEIYTFAVKRLLQQAQIVEKTLFFSNGKLALDFFTEHAEQTESLPDLVLLDLNMPVLDGWQFMEEFIKLSPRINKKITVYIVSSSIDEADQQRAVTTEQVSGFIIKPITLAQLQEITARIFS